MTLYGEKILNRWLKSQTWFKNFEDLRAQILWEEYIDIVKQSMKDNFEDGFAPEDCAKGIIGLAKEAMMKG